MGTYIRKEAIMFVVLFFFMSQIPQLCLCGNINIGCIEREREALLKFRASFNNPSHWLLSTWEENDCCKWKGIGCNNVTGNVISLNLSSPCFESDYRFEKYYNDDDFNHHECFNLEAQNLDPSILQLKHLNHLDLSGNYFNYSPIPMFLGSMTQLTYLSLSIARFGGRIPNNLGNLTNLLHLDLCGYFLYVDKINWISQLSSLQYLDMGLVDLGKAHNLFQVLNLLPSLLQIHFSACKLANSSFPHHPINLTNLTRIEVLDLSSNSLSTPFLNAFQNMTSINVLHLSYINLDSLPFWMDKSNNLVELYFEGNNLDGQFPLALQNLTSIGFLDLSFNNLTSIPLWLANLKSLVHLDLSRCDFQGQIPYALKSMTSLTFLDLSVNNLSSIVPSWLGQLKNLFYLNLQENELKSIEGSLSLILRNMCSLEQLYLFNNKFEGEAFGADEFYGCNKYNLQVLELSTNEFNDSVPSWLVKFENLRVLDLESNLFSGSIPFSLGNLSNLRGLYLSSNHFNGTIPQSLGQLVNLTSLDLSNNHFDGVIPQSFGQLVNLTSLDLSSNHFDGVIPISLGQLVNLISLDLSNNHFDGVILQSLGQLVELRSLNISINNLHGNIPKTFGLLKNLGKLDLSMNSLKVALSEINAWSQKKSLYEVNIANNHIIGPLPENIGDLMLALMGLILVNNKINGSIPHSLCKIKSLYLLDLSNNNLSGEIPDCWKNNTRGLREINLSSNNLSGLIPSSFGNLPTLLSLHLNKNNLQGDLPFSLRNLKNLVIVDLGENQLSGIIPSWIGDFFCNLQILVLRQNKLNGSLPSKICQLSFLQILDLANNQLMGSIPECIGNLSGMIFEQSSEDEITMCYVYDRGCDSTEETLWNENEYVKQVMKGRELEYTKTLKFLVNMDFSNNNFGGLIPQEIVSLRRLLGLNLSHNHFRGEIPKDIGNMNSLESFDVSYNQLSGKILDSMPMITSLNYLNLSYNNFSGSVPIEKQFLTFCDSYFYVGNPLLSGASLQKICVSDGSHQIPGNKGYKEEDGKNNDLEKMWFYFVIVVGYMIGFWGVIGLLIVKKSWRHGLFRWVDDAIEELFVGILIKVAWMKRKMVGSNV